MSTQCDEIDYRLIGEEMQAVVITLDPQEQVVAEAGGMLYMTDGIAMQTGMATDKNKGFFGNLMKAAGRMMTGESFFVTTFTNEGRSRADVTFAAPYPGKILPRRRAHLSEGQLPVRRPRHGCEDSVPEEAGRGPLRRRRLHPPAPHW